VALLLAIAAWFGWTHRTRHVEAVLTAKEWDRSVQVEAYRMVTEHDWSLPSGAIPVSSHPAIREYRQVLDHYETRSRQVSERVQVGTRTYACGHRSRGNGYFEDRTCTEPEYETRYHTETYQDPVYRQVPVWATEYEYRIRRWVPDTLLAAHGTATEPVWPSVPLDSLHREGEKKERYVLTFRDPKGQPLTAEVPLAQFVSRDVGRPVPLVLRGSKVEVDTARH
jgi:hypothetical protein